MAYPPVIDFSAKIVEVQETKRSATSGPREEVLAVARWYSGPRGSRTLVALDGTARPSGSEPLLKQIMSNGKIISEFKTVDAIRAQALKDIRAVGESEPALGWM